MSKAFIKLHEKARIPFDAGCSAERIWEILERRRARRGYSLTLIKQILEDERARPQTEDITSPELKKRLRSLGTAAGHFLERRS